MERDLLSVFPVKAVQGFYEDKGSKEGGEFVIKGVRFLSG